MRVSQYFKIGRTQPYLDFVDVTLETDVPVFADPTAIRGMESPWGQECTSLLQTFFETVLKLIKSGDDSKARELLASLNERNEFHLGYSVGRSQGHGFGAGSAESVWAALTKSQASLSGLLRDLEDTCLLIPGIGPDMLSDAVCNIIRGPLLKYTQDMCQYYGIPLEPQVASGPIWNPIRDSWDHALVPLPMTKKFGKLVLVPKIVVRHRVAYEFGSYYRHYLLPQMQTEEIQANSSLVRLLKDGTRKVTKKDLMNKYGADKLAVVRETVKRPHILQQYRNRLQADPRPPLTHADLADIEGTPLPDWQGLLNKVVTLAVGKDQATDYEDEIEQLLTSLFYPSLCSPVKQHQIHQGRKRIDLTYTNEARRGFFAWLAGHYPCSRIYVECKNYGKEIGNPDLDQLSSRFSPNRGQVGILVCRKIADKRLLMQRCVDTANDHRGFVIPLDDDDLAEIVKTHESTPTTHDFPKLRKLFNVLIDG